MCFMCVLEVLGSFRVLLWLEFQKMDSDTPGCGLQLLWLEFQKMNSDTPGCGLRFREALQVE